VAGTAWEIVNKMRRLTLNLATRPLRNRRLFLLLGGALAAVFLVIALLAVFLFLRFTLKKHSVQVRLSKAEETTRTSQSEQKKIDVRVKEVALKDQGVIETINSIIMRKSFSWTDFLSKLEECLPDSSYILSLAPSLVDDTRIQFRFRVVSRDLNDLLALINKLQELKFSQPRVETEERDDRGQLTSDISVSYERVI
jgi:Tfp pilus assembly protein PilN